MEIIHIDKEPINDNWLHSMRKKSYIITRKDDQYVIQKPFVSYIIIQKDDFQIIEKKK